MLAIAWAAGGRERMCSKAARGAQMASGIEWDSCMLGVAWARQTYADIGSRALPSESVTPPTWVALRIAI